MRKFFKEFSEWFKGILDFPVTLQSDEEILARILGVHPDTAAELVEMAERGNIRALQVLGMRLGTRPGNALAVMRSMVQEWRDKAL